MRAGVTTKEFSMKNFSRARIAPLFRIIALAVVIGFSFAACGGGGGGGGGGGDGPESTWKSGSEIISFYKDNKFIISEYGKDTMRGTYTVNARSVFANIGMTVKEIHGDYITEEMDQDGLKFGKKWYNQSQIEAFLRSWLKKNGVPSSDIEVTMATASSMLAPMFETISGTINDNNTMSIADDTYTMTSGTLPGTSKPGSGTNSGSSKKWTPVANSTFGDNYINAIAYGGNKFVAGGGSGKMATSPDGVTWTAVANSTFGTSSIYAIAYDGSKFIAGGDSGKMAYSINGTDWTAVGDSKLSGEIQAIVGDGTTFVAVVGGAVSYMAYSSDGGITWTAVDVNSTFGTNSNQFDGQVIAYGSGKFVLCTSSASNNGKMWTSTNGSTWTAANNPPFSGNGIFEVIAYGNGKFIGFGNAYTCTVTSTDVNKWTVVTGSLSNTDLSNFHMTVDGIAYGNGKFVAVGYTNSGDKKIAYLSN